MSASVTSTFARLALVTAFVGCDSASVTSQLFTSDERSASEVYMMIGDAAQAGSHEIFLATPAAIQSVGLCSDSSATAACSTSSTSYRAASLLKTKDGRNFFRLTQALPVDASTTHAVVDSSKSEVLLRVRFSDGTAPADPVAAGLSLINEATLKEELTHFASDGFNGRLSGTPENEKARDFIIDHLKRLDIKPARGDSYLQTFRLGVGPTGSQNTANIVAMLPGNDPQLKDEYIVIGAHMDHAGTLQRGYTCSPGSGGDDICNGADDNGSGSIAVLNVAKALAAARQSLKRSVIIMWFSGEEEGLIGSNFYVSRDPIVPIAKTVYMINLDMVGYMRTNGNKLAALGGGTSDAGSRILKEVGKRYPERGISITAAPGGGSDHAPFMAKGIPGVFLHTGVSNNPNYHRTSDSPDKIDFGGMNMAAKVAFELTVRIANEAGLSLYGLTDLAERDPLVSEEELKQTCHHLIKNPNIAEALDFADGNDGRP